MTLRLTCLVPFCRRTRGQRKGEPPIKPGEQWVCGSHWRHVAKTKKVRRRRIRKLLVKAQAQPNRDRAILRLRRMYWALWAEMVAEAIEAAAGIA